MMGTRSGDKDGVFQLPLFGNNTQLDGAALPKHFQHLDTFSSSSHGVGRKVVFTGVQWQELQMQIMIYKYMMASIPVPAELLMSMSKNCQNIASSNSTNPRYQNPSHNSDAEPWRCKRTDGKKWRCSRDVVPDQKYCERHSHKTRPRSRKHVEVHTTTQQQQQSSGHHPNQMAANVSDDKQMSSTLQLNKDHPSLFPNVVSSSRCHNLYMRGEPNSSSAANPNQEWQQQMAQSKQGLKRDYFRSCETNLGSTKSQNLRSESLGFEYGHDQNLQTHSLSDHCSLLLGPNMNSLETQETRHFIDAWSVAERDGSKSSVSREFALPSTLSLSMSGEANQRKEDNAQVFLGTMGSERENLGDSKTHWWLGSTPGGPLAEALCLGISSNATNSASHASSPSTYMGNNSTSSSKSSSGDGRGAGLNLIN